MADDVRLFVGRNVKRLRLATGLTHAGLAERMGVDGAYVSDLEQDNAIQRLSPHGTSVRLLVFDFRRSLTMTSLGAASVGSEMWPVKAPRWRSNPIRQALARWRRNEQWTSGQGHG
jgi:transcriptional regulator with XRE-family HTH domain